MTQPHGWMWTQGDHPGVDQPEWQVWMETLRRRAAGEPWYTGENFRRYPTKAVLEASGLAGVIEGWAPPEPIIGPTSRVLAFGSCFAANFVEWLATHGYNQAFTDSARALMRNPFESVALIAQQFRWAFGEVDPAGVVWIDKDRQQVLATEERRLALRGALLEADVFVTTLGISEIWYDRETGEPLWRVMPASAHDPRRHAFRVESVADTVKAFETIDRIRAQWLPNLRVVYTVSPVPFSATFRPVSAVTANSASKAILRAAVDEFLRARSDLNQTYFYFPGYELVTAVLSHPFKPDNRHLHDYTIDCVMDLFARLYTTHDPTAAARTGAGAEAWSETRELKAVIARLEAHNVELQRACDERLAGMHALKAACDEREAIIEGLRAARVEPAPPSRWHRLAGSLKAMRRR